MKSPALIVGVLLIIFGAVVFAYPSFNFNSREQVAQVGSVQVTADKEKTVWFPPALGGVSIIAGIALVVIGKLRK